MNSRMKFLFLLLTIIWRTKQSQSEIQSANCTLDTCMDHISNQTDMEMIKLNFQCPGSMPCNLSVNTINSTAQCLRDIKLLNTSCPSNECNTLLTTIVTNSLCIPQIVTVEKIMYNPTTIEVCPTPSPLFTSKSSHFITPNTVYITSYPACTPSIVTTTIYQQPPIVLSDVAQTSVLVTCGVLICLPVSVLVIVTYCWFRTRQILKKKRNIDHSAQNSCANIGATAAVKLNNNPAYETPTPLQKNMAYEDTSLTASKAGASQLSQNMAEPAYEVVPLISIQPASTTTHILNNGEGDEYDKLNRDIVQQK